jgi:hypothetical protein
MKGFVSLLHLLLLLLLLPSVPSGLFPIRIYLELWILLSIGLLGRVISPVARHLPTQDNINIEEPLTDIHASSGIRTHDPSV